MMEVALGEVLGQVYLTPASIHRYNLIYWYITISKYTLSPVIIFTLQSTLRCSSISKEPRLIAG
jgi:hypothetical protein